MIDPENRRRIAACSLALFLNQSFASPGIAAVAEETRVRAESFDEEQLLADLRAKRAAAARLLDQMPPVEPRADEILRSLDTYWAGPEVARIFQDLRADLDRQLQNQEIDGSNLDVVRAQLEVVVDKIVGTVGCWLDPARCNVAEDRLGEELQALVESFTRESFESFQPRQRAAFRQAISGMEPRLVSAVGRAQQAIQHESDEAIAELFPVWRTDDRFPALQPPSGALPTVPGSISAGSTGLGVAAGVVAYLLRNILAKMISRIAAATSREVLEKATSRLIPLLGAILAAVDIARIAEAKPNLEATLRQEIRRQYAAELSPTSLWTRSFDGSPSLRTQTRDQVEQFLRSWLQYAQVSARQVLEVALVLEAPDIREYLGGARQRGLPREAIVQEFSDLVQVFGTFVAVQPISTLRRFLVLEPDHQVLRFHVQELGESLFGILQEEGGAEFFAAARIVGIPLIYEVLETPDLDWRQASAAFTGLDPMASLDHKRGLLFCLRHGFDYRALDPRDLELVAGRATLGDDLLADGVRPDKVLAHLLGELPEVLETLSRESRPLLPIVASALSATELAVYREEDARQSLRTAYHFATQELAWSREDCIRSFPVLRELAETSRRYGEVGLRLWRAHVGREGGAAQRERLRRALALYDRGFSPDLLHEPAQLSTAEGLATLPGDLGIRIFEKFHPLGRWAVAFVYGLALALGALLASWIYRRARRR